MRVATISIYNNSTFQLGKNLSEYNDAGNVVTTGKKIQTPSDDPVGYSQVMQINSSLSQLDQLNRNVDTGLTWLNTSESTTDNVRQTILSVKQIALAMSNGTYNDADRASAADQVNQYLDTLIGFANTKVNGQYIFSGTKTDTIPYALDDSTDPPTVTYSGNDAAFAINTGTNSKTDVGTPGSDVFGDTGTGEDLFSLLIQMQDDLKTNGGAGLGDIMTALDSHYENTVNTISNIGIKTNRLDTKQSVISDTQLTLTTNRSNLEDVDLSKAITDLALKQTAYEAALSATSKIISINLADKL